MNTREKKQSKEARFYYKKNRLQQIRGFCTTVQQDCSTRQASKILGIEHSAISLQIRSLEDDLGTKLFKRSNNNRMKLTKEGELFYKKAVIHLQGIDSLFVEFNTTLRHMNENTINIGCDYTVTAYILPKYIRELREQCEDFDNIKVNIYNVGINEAFDMLLNKDVDFVFAGSLENKEYSVEIDKQDIFEYKNTLLVGNQHPLNKNKEISKSDIEQYPYLLLDEYNFMSPEEIFNIKKSNITIKANDWTISKEYVKENLGMIGIPRAAILDIEKGKNNKKLTIFDFDDFFPKMFISLYTLKNYQLKHNAKLLFNIIKKDRKVKH